MNIKQIIADLLKYSNVEVRINRYKYRISWQQDEYMEMYGITDLIVKATPIAVNNKGDVADHTIDYNDYRYTHGGATFRAAVKLCHEINELLPQNENPLCWY